MWGCRHAQVSETNLAVVLVCVEHDGGVGQNVNHIWVLEEIGALQVVAGTEALHDAIDLLGLSGKPERVQVHPDGHIKGQACNAEEELGQQRGRQLQS